MTLRLLKILTSLALLAMLVSAAGTIKNDSLPLCTGNQHKFGEWRLPDEYFKKAKSFMCCGGGHRTTKARPRLDFDVVNDILRSQGKGGLCYENHTIPLVVDQGMVGLNSQCGDDCCACDRRGGTRFNVTRRESHIWVPSNCRLRDWSAQLFCQVLDGKRLLIMGDSTMQQSFATLTSMVSSEGGKCVSDIYYGHSTHLMTSRFRNNVPDLVQRVQPHIVVLSAGAHFSDMGDIAAIFGELAKVMPVLRAAHAVNATAAPWARFIWKSQSPGHVYCEASPGPLPSDYQAKLSPQEAEKIRANDHYNWQLFLSLDEFAERKCSSDPSLGFEFLDMSALYLRPDGHVSALEGARATGDAVQPKEKIDCLHYCLPGPLNFFSQLLLHRLLDDSISGNGSTSSL